MKKRIHSIVALVLVCALVLALPMWAARADALDLDRNGSMTFKLGSFEDLENADAVVDVYKVADLEPDKVYSTFSFNVLKGIELSKPIAAYEDLAALTNEDWQTLAQDAARSVLNGAFDPAGDNADLPCGLYLIVAHGADLEKDEYVVEDDGGNLTTIAYSDEYVYTWLPELVCLPSTVAEITGEVGEDGSRQEISTAGGDWQYDLTVTLKPTQEVRFGDLLVTKTVTTYETSGPATFVFSVVATLRDKVVYDDILALTFDAAGSRTAEIRGKIPVGATVVVTEIYSGASYTLTTDESVEVTVVTPDQDPATAEFTNTYDETLNQGYGILNQFAYSADTGWELADNEHDSAA
ncbi:MAG: hypothetical protein E7426_02480 [Ruminococcaceae bacterium]|jgi:hypothetical protein|nr:hypothetical protein [Oscillospiraceae bacterium]